MATEGLVHGAELNVHMWRRGRNVQVWKFTYITIPPGHAPWFTSSGWYHRARKYVYRLTIDHDYPGNPVWLGRRSGRRWENMEGLYEPLIIAHEHFLIATRIPSYRASRRSYERNIITKAEIESQVYERVINI